MGQYIKNGLDTTNKDYKKLCLSINLFIIFAPITFFIVIATAILKSLSNEE